MLSLEKSLKKGSSFTMILFFYPFLVYLALQLFQDGCTQTWSIQVRSIQLQHIQVHIQVRSIQLQHIRVRSLPV